MEPKIQNFTQFAIEKGYPSDYDTLFQAQLLGSRGLEGKRQSTRSIGQQDSRFHEMQAKNKQAHKEFNEAILKGEVIDADGKITKEKLLAWDYDAKKKEIEGKISSIDSYIRTIEGLGTMSHKPNGKFKIGYQRTFDDSMQKRNELEKQLQELESGITMKEGGIIDSLNKTYSLKEIFAK